MMRFLYFPDHFSEYIPAIIELAIFIILAGVLMYVIIQQSKKREKLVDRQYEQLRRENQKETDEND